MIVLITDYGYQGPYVGQLKVKLAEHAATANVIDLMHDIPVFNIIAANTLIPAITRDYHNCIFVCVVDPGVGGDRKPIILKINSNYFIGPHNGIFQKLIANQKQAIKCWEILWRDPLIFN